MLRITNPFKRNTVSEKNSEKITAKANPEPKTETLVEKKNTKTEQKKSEADNRIEAREMTKAEADMALGNKNVDPGLQELQKKLIEEDMKWLEEESKRPTIIQHLVQDVLLIAGLGGAVLGAASELILSKVKQEEITASKLLKGSLTGSGIGVSLFLMKDLVDTITNDNAS